MVSYIIIKLYYHNSIDYYYYIYIRIFQNLNNKRFIIIVNGIQKYPTLMVLSNLAINYE